MKKRILVTASTFPRWEGDTEPRFVLDLAKSLLNHFDITVLVPATPKAKAEEYIEGVKVLRYHYLPIHKWETLCYPGAIASRIKEKKARVLQVPFLFFCLYLYLLKNSKYYDLVHAHWIIPQGIVQSFLKVPYIVTGHGGDVMELNKGIFKILKKRVLSNAECVTVVSQRLKDRLESMYGITNVMVQSMGCDTDIFTPSKRKLDYFNQGDKKVLLFVGRFVEIKGIRYLLKAMKNIDAKLVIVGKGPQENEIKKIASRLGDKVCFLGPQTHSELAVTYASSDIFIIPSITLPGGVTEGAPTVITEAMASGLPVVGSNSGGISEMICDGVNGFVIEEKNSIAIADKVNVLLSDIALYNSFSQNARKTGEGKSFDKVAIAFEKLFDNI